jgi:hypothetical protein
MRLWLPSLAIVAAMMLSSIPPAARGADDEEIEHFKRAMIEFEGELQPELSSPRFDAIRAPDRVESVPVERRTRRDRTSGQTIVDHVPIVSQTLPVPPALAAELAKLILAAESYFPGYKMCGFNPGIVYRFRRGKAAVAVAVCFDCNDLQFSPSGPGLTSGKLSFDPIRNELARLVRDSRPADPRFKALRPRGGSDEFDELLKKARAGGAKP